MIYVKKIIKSAINLALLALAALCSIALHSCNSSNTLRSVVNDVRPSTYYEILKLDLHGDTLSYFRIAKPRR